MRRLSSVAAVTTVTTTVIATLATASSAFAQDAVGRLTPAPDPGGQAFAWQPMALQEPTELQGLGQRGAGLQVQADEVTGALRRAEDHLDGDHRGP